MFLRTSIALVLAAVLSQTIAAFAEDGGDLREQWRNPPLEYRLNKIAHSFPLDARRREAFIQSTLDEGWGGFALNAPFRQYLTDAGMKATLQFCESAQAKGMDLWLYDEEGYPSGSAGGRVSRENAAWEAMGLFFSDAVVQAGPITFTIPPGDPLQIVAFPLIDGQADFGRPTDLKGALDGSQLKWTAPEGEWLIFAATKHSLYEGFQADRNPFRHPSPMVADATDAFLRITHDKYAEHLGNDLGKYFTSTFTDEPSSMAMQFHRYSHRHAVLPWHEALSVAIEKRYGYRPEGKLIELFYDVGPKGQQVRYQYFKTVGDLIAENYFARIRDWCRSHNFRSGGHLLLEESLIAHAPLYGNIMQCFRMMDAPGIDILSCYPADLPVHSPKLASSAAELIGQNRVMSEPCPIDGKPAEPPVDAVRGFFNLLVQGGVTDFNCYLKLNSLDREQRVELNRYVGRLGMLLRGGHTAAEIGVVYPIESLWTQYTPRYQKVIGWQHVSGAAQAVNEIDSSFRRVSRFLFDHRWEYLFLDSQALIDGAASDGQLACGPLRFNVLLFPSVSVLPAEAWSKLLDFAGQGGKLVFLEAKPLNSDLHFPDRDVAMAFEQLIETHPNVVFLDDWAPEALGGLLDQWLEKPVRLSDESLPLRLAHRRIENRDVVFLVNDSPAEVTAAATFRAQGELGEWDPATAEVARIANETGVKLKPYHGKVYRTVSKN